MATAEDLKDEIAYIRSLAEEGHKPTGDGGLNLVVAGVGWAIASAAQAAVFAGTLPAALSGWVWMLPLPVYIPVLVWISKRRKAAGRTSPSDAILDSAWMSVGCAMGAMIVAFIVRSAVTGNGYGWMMMPAVMIAGYGSAWMIYSLMSKQRWVMGFAIACFGFAPVSAGLANNGVQSLLGYSAGLLALVALPGAIMMFKARRIG